MFLKLKNHEATVKGRRFADGRSTRNWISKEGTSLLTMSTEILMRSCIIDTMEGQYLLTNDIPVSFLQNYYNKGDIHIMMKG